MIYNPKSPFLYVVRTNGVILEMGSIRSRRRKNSRVNSGSYCKGCVFALGKSFGA